MNIISFLIVLYIGWCLGFLTGIFTVIHGQKLSEKKIKKNKLLEEKANNILERKN